MKYARLYLSLCNLYLFDTLCPQDPTLLSSMDPAQIAAAVQHCPIPLDSALQVWLYYHEYLLYTMSTYCTL